MRADVRRRFFWWKSIARRDDQKRSAIARGRDIYAITAPIVVEAAARILDGNFKRKGIGAPAEIFDARDFLEALVPEHLTMEIPCSRTITRKRRSTTSVK